MRVFVTGSAGFIGFHLCRLLLSEGHEVLGYDGMTEYYDVTLKQARVGILLRMEGFTQVRGMLEDLPLLEESVSEFKPDVVIHLAAQAGVRYSLENPAAYISSNIVGTYNLLEVTRRFPPSHLLLASTSSVYGGNDEIPFQEVQRTDFPVSLYAATKSSGESLSHSYSHLFKTPTTCFRFFTVYGPWGRPDMALFKFVARILRGDPIEVYGQGNMRRDFTYIDDLVRGITLLMTQVPQVGEPIEADGVTDSLSSVAPWRVVNIAGGQPVGLMDFIKTIESHLGIDASKIFLPMQKGDVPVTFADPRLFECLTDFQASTGIDVGVRAFIDWYLDYTKSNTLNS